MSLPDYADTLLCLMCGKSYLSNEKHKHDFTPAPPDRFLYWYQELEGELEGTPRSMYGTFLTHAEAVSMFKDKYKYGLVSPRISAN